MKLCYVFAICQILTVFDVGCLSVIIDISLWGERFTNAKTLSVSWTQFLADVLPVSQFRFVRDL